MCTRIFPGELINSRSPLFWFEIGPVLPCPCLASSTNSGQGWGSGGSGSPVLPGLEALPPKWSLSSVSHLHMIH